MKPETTVASSKITGPDCINHLLNKAVESKYAVAIWRLPNDATTHFIASRNIQRIKPDLPLEELSGGFLFAPFDRTQDRIFLPADYKFSFSDGMLRQNESALDGPSHHWLTSDLHTRKWNSPPLFYQLKESVQDSSVPLYTDLVNACIHEIEKGTFEKIVPSRRSAVSLGKDFNVTDAFEKLCLAHPNALVSFVSSPETGSWLGATPEVLVSVEDKSIFRTVALAGTQSYHEGINLKSVAWTQKEIEEQALVERYIISCFKKIRVREYEEHGPKTVVAGNLMHLKSDFTVDMKAINFPQLGSVMLHLLHPTSAVCGMPLDVSLEFLRKNEGYDRRYYSGYLGPVGIDNNTDIFVNLRCMQLTDEHAWLYAGAGVTVDSVPEMELEETEIKLKTLLAVIR